MTDVLIRDVPQPVLRKIDRLAEDQALSRGEYLRRQLSLIARTEPVLASLEDLERAAAAAEDLASGQVMAQAWQ